MSMSNKFLTNVVAASAETIYKNYKSMTAVLNHLEHNKMKPKPRLHSHRAIQVVQVRPNYYYHF